MKLFVFFLFAALPWLPWIGDWALRWTKGNEALEITFALFIFPLCMNAIQYWIIDNFIMDKQRETGDKGSYQAVGEDEEEDEERRRFVVDDDEDEDAEERDGNAGGSPPLKEANPTPIPVHSSAGGAGQQKKQA